MVELKAGEGGPRSLNSVTALGTQVTCHSENGSLLCKHRLLEMKWTIVVKTPSF